VVGIPIIPLNPARTSGTSVPLKEAGSTGSTLEEVETL